MKRNFGILFFLVIGLTSHSLISVSQTSNQIGPETARKAALTYCLQLKDRYFGNDGISLSLAEEKRINNTIVYYAFNLNGKNGFVIISADRNSPPVLCFQPGLAYESDPAKRDPSFNDWLEAFMIQIESAIATKTTSDRMQKLWDAYTVKGLLDSEIMELKLTTLWHQGYTAYAPVSLAGCVAVAMAQVINYYQWPVNGTGFKEYTDPPNDPVQWPDRFNCGGFESSYGVFNLTSGDHTGVYDYTKMKNNDFDEISRLIFNAAVSVDMDWTGCGSWANTPVVVEPALETYFGYSTDAQYISIDDYTETEWNSMLIEQIRNERPFIYRGLQSTTGWSGHAWVGMGYKTVNGETQYLFNLGWGNIPGYYTLMSTGFTYNQGAVINIFPVSQPDLLVTTASVTENPIISGEPFTLEYSATNQGTLSATSTTIACYLSNDQTLDGDDTFIETTTLPSLAIDQTVNGSIIDVIIDIEITGNYFILIETDPDHYVHESDEVNNVYVLPVTVQGGVPAYPFRSVSDGSWEDNSTWEFNDGSGWNPATSYPSASSGNITIQSEHNIVINNSKVLDEVTVEQNAKVTVSSGITVTIAGGPEEKDFRVYGTLENYGTISTTGVLAFEDGSEYLHSRDGGSIPVAEWGTGSDCRITGILTTAPAINSGTQFGNFIWDCPLQAADISLSGRLNSIIGDFEIISTNNITFNNNALLLGTGESGNLTIEGSFYLKGNSTFVIAASSAQREMNVYENFSILDSNSKFYFGSPNLATLKVAGDFSHLSGIITGPGSIVFIGSEMQLYTSGAPPENIINVNYTVNNGAYLQMGSASSISYIGGSGTFTLSAGGTLGITSANGISSAGSSGNIQITTRVYNSGANYVYNGSGAQASGNGLPRTVNSIKLAGTTDFTFTNGITKSDPATTNSGFTVEAGARVTITQQQAVSVGANLVNNGILNLEADASGLASLMINGTYSGAGNVKSEIWMTGGDAGTEMWRWHYFAVPSQQSSESLAALYGDNIMKYDDAASLADKSEGWKWYDGWDQETQSPNPANGFANLNVSEGYAYYNDDPVTIELNSGSLPSSLGIVGLNYGTFGWNLLGNSLTCGLNWDNVSFSGDVDQTVFFLKDYVEYYYIKDGPGSPLGENDGHIPPYQGFFVNANAPGALIDFSNAREHNSTLFYKKGESRDDSKRRNFPIIRLTFGNNILTDETVIWFKSEATYDNDSRFDAEKWYSEGSRPQIYSSAAGKNYAINGIPFPTSPVKIPLGYYAPAEGKYTIGRLQLENAGNYLIYLEDLDQNVKIRLDQTEKYSFATDKGSFADRFIISINSLSENPEDLGKEQFKLYAFNEMINIIPLTNEWEEQQVTLRVFDITGKTLMINKDVKFQKGEFLQFPLSNYRKGIYFVEIRTKKLKYTGKVPLK